MLFVDHQSLVSRPHLPEEGPIEADPAPAGSEAPKAGKIRMEMKPKDLWRRATLLRRLPSLYPKIEIWRKRGSM
jgi:hypothetical protein